MTTTTTTTTRTTFRCSMCRNPCDPDRDVCNDCDAFLGWKSTYYYYDYDYGKDWRLLRAEKKCRNYEVSGSCKYGRMCFFSHGGETADEVLDRLNKVVCPSGARSECPYIYCPYSHSPTTFEHSCERDSQLLARWS